MLILDADALALNFISVGENSLIQKLPFLILKRAHSCVRKFYYFRNCKYPRA